MSSLANVERRGAEFIVTSYTQTPEGFWQMNGQFSRIPSDADSERLGQAVLDALAASNRVPLGHTEGSTGRFAPVLAALGLKTYAQYMKGSVSVSVETRGDDLVRITPMRNGGAREGFVEMTDQVRVVEDRSPASLGTAVAETLQTSA